MIATFATRASSLRVVVTLSCGYTLQPGPSDNRQSMNPNAPAFVPGGAFWLKRHS